MDNTDNQPQTTTQGQVQNMTAIDPLKKPEEPNNPVSGPHKELGQVIEAPVSEYVEVSNPDEIEPTIAPEVKEAGVESIPSQERPQLTEEHKKAGLDHAPEATPVSTASSMAIQLPYTYAQVQQRVKETGVEESAHWLAVLHKFILEKLGRTS